jgi:hypothetical protein
MRRYLSPRSLPVAAAALLLALLGLSGASGDQGPCSGTRVVMPDYSVTFTPQSDWGSGFVGEVSIVNRTAGRVNCWQLEFEFDRQVVSIWNGRVVEHSGHHYVVEGEAWNSWIDPGAKVSFGFTGAPGQLLAGPTGYRLTGIVPASSGGGGGDSGSVSIRYITDSDWGSGFVGRIEMTNRGAADVADWILEFDLDRNLTSIWNARFLSHVGMHYRIGPESWNRTIPAGGQVSLGFVGAPGNVGAGPTGLRLAGSSGSALQSIQVAPANLTLTGSWPTGRTNPGRGTAGSRARALIAPSPRRFSLPGPASCHSAAPERTP